MLSEKLFSCRTEETVTLEEETKRGLNAGVR